MAKDLRTDGFLEEEIFYVYNFKSYKGLVPFYLSKTTFLYGENSSGKTAFIDSFRLLKQLLVYGSFERPMKDYGSLRDVAFMNNTDSSVGVGVPLESPSKKLEERRKDRSIRRLKTEKRWERQLVAVLTIPKPVVSGRKKLDIPLARKKMNFVLLDRERNEEVISGILGFWEGPLRELRPVSCEFDKINAKSHLFSEVKTKYHKEIISDILESFIEAIMDTSNYQFPPRANRTRSSENLDRFLKREKEIFNGHVNEIDCLDSWEEKLIPHEYLESFKKEYASSGKERPRNSEEIILRGLFYQVFKDFTSSEDLRRIFYYHLYSFFKSSLDDNNFPRNIFKYRITERLGDLCKILVHSEFVSPIRPVLGRAFENIQTIEDKDLILASFVKRSKSEEELTSSLNTLMKELGLDYEINVQFLETLLKKDSRISSEFRDYVAIRLKECSTGLGVAFADVGTGISQILPILIQMIIGDEYILFIEQPELHVHPRLQGNIGQLLAKTAINRNKRVVVETHSENIYLRLQKLVRASGKEHIDPKTLSFIYVSKNKDEGSIPTTIEMDEDGEFKTPWPSNFAEVRLEELT